MTINATDPSAVTPSTVVRFQPGELVDVTIRAARIMAPRLGFGDVLTLAYEEVEPGVFATIELRHPQAGSVTIERVGPAEWPPLPGDLWRDREGTVWFATDRTDYDETDETEVIAMVSQGEYAYGGDRTPDNLRGAYGPLSLVYRRESDGDQS